jgi:hypothetical protein
MTSGSGPVTKLFSIRSGRTMRWIAGPHGSGPLTQPMRMSLVYHEREINFPCWTSLLIVPAPAILTTSKFAVQCLLVWC